MRSVPGKVRDDEYGVSRGYGGTGGGGAGTLYVQGGV